MTTGADWVDQARRLVDSFLAGAVSAPAPEEGSGGAAHADTCRWCPICQAAAVARGERPEVSAALADVLTAAAGALRAFGAEGAGGRAAPAPEVDDGADDGADDGVGAPDEDPGPTVQRIEIG
ncbi:MAG: uncharacterized protein JWP40_2446 [Blastococcus sp.]|jgi:hypothetical protein|nr:uncharacterized protein [Blastococcus sp.]